MKFSTNARFIFLTPETLEEAFAIWEKCDDYGKHFIIQASHVTKDGKPRTCVLLDLAATHDRCLKPRKGER